MDTSRCWNTTKRETINRSEKNKVIVGIYDEKKILLMLRSVSSIRMGGEIVGTEKIHSLHDIERLLLLQGNGQKRYFDDVIFDGKITEHIDDWDESTIVESRRRRIIKHSSLVIHHHLSQMCWLTDWWCCCWSICNEDSGYGISLLCFCVDLSIFNVFLLCGRRRSINLLVGGKKNPLELLVVVACGCVIQLINSSVPFLYSFPLLLHIGSDKSSNGDDSKINSSLWSLI